jgi:hypothetical protein
MGDEDKDLISAAIHELFGEKTPQQYITMDKLKEIY